MNIINSTNIDVYKKEIQSKISEKEIQKEEKEIKKEEPIKTPKDTIDISILKEEADKAYAHLRSIVEDLLKRQGKNFEDIENFKVEDLIETLKDEDFVADEKAIDEAKQMIEEGGPLSPESVSDRIVDFAKSISGGDKNKFELLKGAIEEGFEAAKEIFGDELPEISQKTYDLVQEKLNSWNEE